MPAQRPTRDQYVHWEQVTTRWADIDVYGHMNNARYFEIIDTVVNNHLEQATGTDIRKLPAIGVVAEVGCKYFAEVGYPAPVDVGVVRREARQLLGGLQGRAVPGARQRTRRRGGRGGHLRARVRRQHRPGPPGHPDPEEIRAAVASLVRS